MQSNFLTIEEIADTLKITRQTVSKFIQKKELNAIRINKSYRVTYSDFQSFINENSVVSESAPIYLKESRFCQLDYEDKMSEADILNLTIKGKLLPLELNHKNQFNKFIVGDNFFVLKHLIDEIRGKVDLIYIDPPFGTGQDFTDIDNNHAYSDRLAHSEFLEFLRKRLILLRECLSERGSIYLHIDKKIGHYVKIIMDEIFGYDNFINDITRIKCNPKNFSRNAYGNYSDMILFYAKKRDANIWNEVKQAMTTEEEELLFPKIHPKYGRYTTNPLHAPGETVNGDTGKKWKGLLPPKGRHWRYSRQELTRLDEQGLIEWSETGNPRKIVFAKDHDGKKIQDVWEYKDRGLSYVDYPTQKNHDLLRRIVHNSSEKGSLVLDCFAGSGGTLLIANELKRNWIGIDNSPNSLDKVKISLGKAQIKGNYFSYTSLD